MKRILTTRDVHEVLPDKVEMFPEALHQVVEIKLHLARDDHIVLAPSQPKLGRFFNWSY
jgi:hypothetical protein